MNKNKNKPQFSAAVVGCGTIAPVHINALLAADIRISALCDVDIKKAEILKKKFSLNCVLYEDYFTLIKDNIADCVHICTPHNFHAMMTIFALENDVNVFVEKPLAVNRSEVEQIQSAAKKSKSKVGVCFQNRYLPSNIKAKVLAQKNMTESAFFSVIWTRSEEYFEQAPWRSNLSESGGGALINQGIHTLDLLMWFLGEPKFVTASVNNYKKLGSVEDTVSGLLNFGNNLSASFYVTTASASNRPVNVILKGKKQIEIDGVFLVVDGVRKRFNNNPEQKLVKEYWGNGHLFIIKDFYNCLRLGRRFAIDETEGARALKAVFSIYQSNGKKISFSE